MSPNKKIVKTWLDGITGLDGSALQRCLVEDAERVEWADGSSESGVPTRGRAAIIRSMDRPANVAVRFEVTRMTEENDTVVAEGFAHITKEDGVAVTLKFCDIFEFEGGKVKRLDSFTAMAKTSK